MRPVIISVANHERILATGEQMGLRVNPSAIDRGPGRVEILLDEDVCDALAAIDVDPDRALEVLFTTGVGHA